MLILAIGLQKLLNYFILEQAACALSERRAEVALIEWSRDKSPFSFSPLALRGISKLKGNALAAAAAIYARGGISPNLGQLNRRNTQTGAGGVVANQEILTPNLGDYVERVLETSAAGIFSPGNRYISSMFPKRLYAGLPRQFWKKLYAYGLLEEVDLIGDEKNGQGIETGNNDGGYDDVVINSDPYLSYQKVDNGSKKIVNETGNDNNNFNTSDDFMIGEEDDANTF